MKTTIIRMFLLVVGLAIPMGSVALAHTTSTPKFTGEACHADGMTVTCINEDYACGCAMGDGQLYPAGECNCK